MTEVAPVRDPPHNKPNKFNALVKLTQRHGREDNMLYRQTEGGRTGTKNHVKIEEVRRRLGTSLSDYDFRRDFLGK